VSTPAVRLHDVAVAYASVVVVRDVSLELAPAELHAVLGASGSGKTTLLRAIAGFAPIARGRIELFDSTVDEGERFVPPEARGVGVVFQDLALFPHLDAAANIAFGRPRGSGQTSEALLARVGLAGYGARHVSDLSGGEQQRIALARVLAQEPRMVVLDEPFSSLNRELRRTLREATVALLRERGIAALLVTHDAEEAFAFADRVSVLHQGRLLQTAPPRELYERPRSLAVARSAGDVVVLEARAAGARTVRCALGEVTVHDAPDDTRLLVLRPEQLRLHDTAEATPGTPARVAARRYLGATEELELALPSSERVLARTRAGVLARGLGAAVVTVEGLGVAFAE
jgi:iron(III) transport system ATP-binding protein